MQQRWPSQFRCSWTRFKSPTTLGGLQCRWIKDASPEPEKTWKNELVHIGTKSWYQALPWMLTFLIRMPLWSSQLSTSEWFLSCTCQWRFSQWSALSTGIESTNESIFSKWSTIHLALLVIAMTSQDGSSWQWFFKYCLLITYFFVYQLQIRTGLIHMMW